MECVREWPTVLICQNLEANEFNLKSRRQNKASTFMRQESYLAKKRPVVMAPRRRERIDA
jgi:hypothetical protein